MDKRKEPDILTEEAWTKTMNHYFTVIVPEIKAARHADFLEEQEAARTGRWLPILS
jgi:hypothetical protein